MKKIIIGVLGSGNKATSKDTKNALRHITQHFGKSEDNLANIKIIKPSLVDIFESMQKK